MDRSFHDLIRARWEKTAICVGLDPDFERLPKCVLREDAEETLYRFFCAIIDATKDLALSYKPNIAFFVRFGAAGLRALKRILEYVRKVAPKIPIILDSKRGDIDNTNLGYVHEAFEHFDCDAVTVSPYLGAEALSPFLRHAEKGIIALVRTSNKGSDELQCLPILAGPKEAEAIHAAFRGPLENKFLEMIAERCEDKTSSVQGLMEYADVMLLWHRVMYRVFHSPAWNANRNTYAVFGATHSDELDIGRAIAGDNAGILLPGIGAQQKGIPLREQIKRVVSAGTDSRGTGMIINLSREVLYASSGEDFAEAARAKVIEVRDGVHAVLDEVIPS